jgi:two-component system, sensor histidine kinase and response regulator
MPPTKARSKRGASDEDRFVFRHAAAALWEEDVSALLALAGKWKKAGVDDVRAHLRGNPEVLREALAAITTVAANGAARRLCGARTPGDPCSPWDPLLTESAPDAAAAIVAAVVEGEDGARVPSRLQAADGSPLDLQLHPPDPKAGYPWLLVNAVGSGDRAREQSILRAVVDAIPDQLFVKDREGRFVFANRQLADWTGEQSPRDLLGKTDLDYFPREMAEKFRADDRAIVASGQTMTNIEEDIRSAEGENRSVLTTKVLLHDPAGRVVGVIGMVRDITRRKRLERSLDDERRLMRTLIDSLPDGIFMKDRQGRFLLANRVLAEVMGIRSPEELIGKTDRGFYPAERAASFEGEEKRVLEGGQTLVNEAEAWDVNGSRRWLQLTKIPLRDREGLITGLVGVGRDVTMQKNAEGELAAERTYLKALMDNSFDYIYFKDRQSRFLKTSRAHAKLFGLDPTQVVGKTDFDFFSPEHARAAFDDEQRIIQTGEPAVDLEERETWPDRTDTWVTTTKLPLKDATGRIIGTFGISRDITQRRQIEERNLLLAAMVEHSNEAIIGVDLEDRVTSWNRGAEKVFGYRAEEMEGKSIIPLIAFKDSPLLASAKGSLGQRGRVHQFDSTVQRKDGKQVFVSSTRSLIEDSKGRIIGTTLISRDVTEQKALLAQVIRAQRLESLGTLAAGIAHQFNNINAAVKGYLDVAAGEDGVPQNVQSWIREALKGVLRSVEITERLQSFGSAAHARQEAIDLAEIVPTLLPLFDAQAKEQGVVVHRQVVPAVVRASRSTLNFVITSLVNNSLHALLDRPVREITLRSRPQEAYCVLEVADTGCGISGENLPRVFTPFFTTKGEWSESGSPQARVKGVGLSLCVCQSTVAEQGGWIEVESLPGEGTTIRVWLPSAGTVTG